MAFFGFGRRTKDKPVKRATGRGRGAGRTRNTRMDDLQDARNKRKPQGVTSPIKDAAKPTKPPTTTPRPPKADKQPTTAVERPKAPKAEVKPTVVRRAYNNPAMNKKLVDKENKQKKAAAKAAKSKPAVVTPKMIKDAGFTNLRDYLNAKQGKTRVQGAPTVTGKGGRNVGIDYKGAEKKANVTKEQLDASGMKSLKDYLNYMDKNDGKRPPKKKAVKKAGGGMMKSKMKAKGMKAGGKMTSKMKPKGMKKGGKFPDLNKDGKVTQKDILMGRGVVKKKTGGAMKTKGYAKGGMKSKGYAKGGKVRGAGIARKGVRPAKMR